MKAITLWQPWATLVAIGAKTIETRSWSTSYRGPLAIHAAKSTPARAWREAMRPGGNIELALRAFRVAKDPRDLPRGVILATCVLADVEEAEKCKARIHERGDAEESMALMFGDFSPGRFAWHLVGIKPCEAPIEWPGMQGLWECPGLQAVAR